jgi:hypothetical protein
MIHGDCSSRGCYAMTDEQIAEIYSLARESFFGGQKSFQIQAYPFRMTPMNLARHRNSPHVAFWKMLKEGYDHFEVTHLEPKVDVCEKHYVFDAESSGKFSPSDRCPAYKVPEDIAAAVRNKQARDDAQIAELINRGTPTAPAKMAVDGGMNPTFLSAVKMHGGPGATIHTASGTIPPHVNPPAESSDSPTGSFPGSFLSLASAESKPAPAPATAPRASSVQVASAAPTGSSGIGSFFSNLFSKGEDQAATQKPAKPAPGAVRPKSEPQPAETKTAAAKPQPAPPRQEASAEPGKPDSINSLLNGAAPTVPSGGFENRFGAWR